MDFTTLAMALGFGFLGILWTKHCTRKHTMNKTNTESTDIVRYYYLRDKKDPVGCVCMIKDKDGRFFRGISLCNTKKDQFSKKIARNIALNRAMKAKKEIEGELLKDSTVSGNDLIALGFDLSQKMLAIFNNYGPELVNGSEKGYWFMSGFVVNPSLTDEEKEMWKDILIPSFKKTVDKIA